MLNLRKRACEVPHFGETKQMLSLALLTTLWGRCKQDPDRTSVRKNMCGVG